MAFTKIVGAGIHTLSNVHTHNINSSGIITATQFVGIFTGTDGNFSGDLDVGGNVSIGCSLTVNGDFTTLNTTLREVEILNVDANSSESAGIITQRGSGDILNLFDTNTEVFTVKDGGNVGIKTDSPTSDLQVDGTSLSLINKVDNSNTFIKVENTGPGNAGVKIKNSNGEFTFIANDRLRIMDEDAGGVERISLASNGNVGINSIAPTARLDVNGTLNVSGDTVLQGRLNITGVTTVADNLNVSGISTFSNSVNVKKTINTQYSPTTAVTPIVLIRNDASLTNSFAGLRLQAHNANAAASTFNISVLNSSTNYKSTLVLQSRDAEND